MKERSADRIARMYGFQYYPSSSINRKILNQKFMNDIIIFDSNMIFDNIIKYIHKFRQIPKRLAKMLFDYQLKYCSDCDDIKPLSEFYCDNRGGFLYRCKKCHSIETEQRRQRETSIVLHIISNGRMTCKDCGEDDYDLLTIDHIYGGGGVERKNLGSPSLQYLASHLETMDLSKYEIICWNCQYKRRMVLRMRFTWKELMRF